MGKEILEEFKELLDPVIESLMQVTPDDQIAANLIEILEEITLKDQSLTILKIVKKYMAKHADNLKEGDLFCNTKDPDDISNTYLYNTSYRLLHALEEQGIIVLLNDNFQTEEEFNAIPVTKLSSRDARNGIRINKQYRRPFLKNNLANEDLINNFYK